MSVSQPKGKVTYQYQFAYRNRRFKGSCKTANKREAERVEAEIRKKREAEVDAELAAGTSLKMVDVTGRYYDEVGQGQAAAQNVNVMLGRLAAFFGPETLITDLTHADVGRLVAWRRGHRIERGGKKGAPLSPYTINDQTEQLKKVVNWLKGQGVEFRHQIAWAKHMLREPKEHPRELMSEEKAALDAATRDDYADIIAFANMTGLRQNECILRWSEVRFESRQIVKTGKGGEPISIPIDDVLRELLWRQKGGHPVYVFTYVCQRVLKGGKGEARLRGERYPITKQGLKTIWRRLRAKAGVESFKFHDFRHDFATKLLRATQNLKLVQQALNHKRIETTLRYAYVLDEERREAVASLRAQMAGRESGDSTAAARPPFAPPTGGAQGGKRLI